MNYLSVIIPCYNVEKTVERCIESIEKSGDPSIFEIIAVNDGSTDNTKCVLDKLALRYQNISILNEENIGCIGARMNGCLHASGEFCTSVDADDFVDEQYITMQYDIINKHPGYDYYFLNNYIHVEGTNTFKRERDFRSCELKDKSSIFDLIWNGFDGAIWNKIFKTKIMQNANLSLRRYYKVVLNEDLFINSVYLMQSKVNRIWRENVCLLYHYGGLESGVCSQMIPRNLDDAIYTIQFLNDFFIEYPLSDRKIQSTLFYKNLMVITSRRKNLIQNCEINKEYRKKDLKEIEKLSEYFPYHGVKNWLRNIYFRLFLYID